MTYFQISCRLMFKSRIFNNNIDKLYFDSKLNSNDSRLETQITNLNVLKLSKLQRKRLNSLVSARILTIT